MSTETIRQNLQVIKDTIAAARATLDKGASVDLTALQDSVKTVCDEINGLPRLTDCNEIEQLIKNVLMDFDALSQALDAQRQNVTTNEVPRNNHYTETSTIRIKDENNAGEV